MNIAVIFAGGAGVRMKTSGAPKQFLKVYDKPVIIYTLEKFQFSESIDAIVIACLESYIDHTRKLCERFGISKVRRIVPGGATGQESIYNGLCAAGEISQSDGDIVLIHDGVRPLINDEIIRANVACALANGNAITCAECKETVAVIDADGAITATVDRSRSRLARAPQSFRIGDIRAAHERARAEGQSNVIDSCTLMSMYGHKLYSVPCGSENIKITTPDDFFLFKAILESQQNMQAF